MPFEAAEGYVTWYDSVSHPFWFPPEDRVRFVEPRLHEEPEVAVAVSRHFKKVFDQPDEESERECLEDLFADLRPYYEDVYE